MGLVKSKSPVLIEEGAMICSVRRDLVLVCPDYLLEASRSDLTLSSALRAYAEYYGVCSFAHLSTVKRAGLKVPIPDGFSIMTIVGGKQCAFSKVSVPVPGLATLGRRGYYGS